MEMPRLLLSVIGDEIGPTLDDMLSFCAEEGVSRLEMRTIGGRNLLGMTLDEVADVAARIHKAKLTVPTFVSPLLKWAPPGKRAKGGKVDFAFDPDTCPADDPVQHAFDIALMLGASRLRVFTYLTYEGFAMEDLREPLAELCDFGDAFGVDIQIENEPVCNVATIDDLATVLATFDNARVKPLVDICNAVAAGAPPSPMLLTAISPRVDHIHLKDWSNDRRKVAPIGEGDIDFAKLLPPLLSLTRAREVLASIETHVPADARNATRKNVAAVRRIAREIGAEIV